MKEPRTLIKILKEKFRNHYPDTWDERKGRLLFEDGLYWQEDDHAEAMSILFEEQEDYLDYLYEKGGE